MSDCYAVVTKCSSLPKPENGVLSHCTAQRWILAGKARQLAAAVSFVCRLLMVSFGRSVISMLTSLIEQHKAWVMTRVVIA